MEGVAINVKSLSTKTDAAGHFRIIIPTIMQAEEQRVSAFKEGFAPWDFVGPASQAVEWKIILEPERTN